MGRMTLDSLLRHDDSRMRRAAVKLTHVGEQTVPVSTVVIHDFHYLPSMEAFRWLQTPGVSYANDDLPTILNFAAATPELRRIVGEASRIWQAADQGGRPSLSFAVIVDAPEGLEGDEVLLTHQGGVTLHRAIGTALDPGNRVGATVLAIQRLAAYEDR